MTMGGFGGGLISGVVGQAIIEVVVDNSGLEKSLTQSQKRLAGAAVAGWGAAVVMAGTYETAMAGVSKTTGLQGKELDDLGKQFRDLARNELPATASALANTAATAAQLGVEDKNLASFTETMTKLGTATNIVGQQGATDLARFINISGETTDHADRLASSLVDLGNNSATTEGEILSMGMRTAAAGKQFGLTASQTLGLSAAMSSLGLEAEAGGTAASRVMLEIWSAAKKGEPAVRKFADVAGMLPGEFIKLLETDPAQALTAFIGGLGTAEQRGLNVVTMLDDLSFGNVRVRDALLRLAGAQGLMTESMQLSSKAYAENIALDREFETFKATAANQLKLVANALIEVGIVAGDRVLPALVAIAQGVAWVARGFADLPGPLQAVILIWGTLVTLGPVLNAVLARLVVGYNAVAAAAAKAAAAQGLQAKVGAFGAMAGTGGAAGVLAAVTATAVVVDAILKKTSGHGLIDWLFRDPQTADAAAAAVARVNAELEATGKAGDQGARIAAMFAQIREQAAAAGEAQRKIDELANRGLQGGKSAQDLKVAKAAIKELVAEAAKAGAPFEQLSFVINMLDEELQQAAREAIPNFQIQQDVLNKSLQHGEVDALAAARGVGDLADAAANAISPLSAMWAGLNKLGSAALFDAVALAAFDGAITGVSWDTFIGMMEEALRKEAILRDRLTAAHSLADPSGRLRGLDDDWARTAASEAERAAKEAERALQEAQDAADKLTKTVHDANVEMRKAAIQRLDDLGDAVVTALRRQAETERDVRLNALEKQQQDAQKASDARLRQMQREHDAAVKLIDSERDAKIAAIQGQLDAMDAEDLAGQFAEIDDALKLAFDPREAERLQKQRKQLERQVQRDALRGQQDDIRTDADARKRALDDQLEARKQAERDALDSTLTEYKDMRTRINDLYEAQTVDATLASKARTLLASGEFDTIVKLLKDHYPEFQVAGRGIGDQIINGIGSADIAGYIRRQIQGVATGIGVPVGGITPTMSPAAAGMIGEIARLKEGGAPLFAIDELRKNFANTFGFPSPLAKGALITRPTFAHLGEVASARPEIVSPERRLREIVREESGGGMGDIHIFIGDREITDIVRVEVRSANEHELTRGASEHGVSRR